MFTNASNKFDKLKRKQITYYTNTTNLNIFHQIRKTRILSIVKLKTRYFVFAIIERRSFYFYTIYLCLLQEGKVWAL